MTGDSRVFAMVIEHELMHQETRLYLLQRLPLEQKVRPTWLPGYVMAPGRPGGGIEIPAGPATIGARFDDLPFGWDNEFPAVQAAVPAFRIDGTPVTNGQYLAFVEDGGSRRAELWGDEDWLWRGQEAMEHRVVWGLLAGRWRYRALFARLPLESVAGWPVYVSLAEARAFARWRGERLPTEAEFHRAAFCRPDGGRLAGALHVLALGEAMPAVPWGHVGFRRWAAPPAGSHSGAA